MNNDDYFEQNRYHVFSKDIDNCTPCEECEQKKTVLVVAYLYYRDMLPELSRYLNALPCDIDVVVISSDDRALERARSLIKPKGKTQFVLQANVGRDISALLITAKKYIDQAEYVCFVHDKKEHQWEERLNETEFWVHNIWENTIASEAYIRNVISFFEKNSSYGVLTVPSPLGLYFDTWAGQGWYGSYEATKNLASLLRLDVEIKDTIPPVSIGTALWFRPGALKKLFDFGWDYSDFDDAKLGDGNYLSYAVERIFSYVAKDAGYKTGIVMTDEYAAEQALRAQNIAALYADTLNELVGVTLGIDCIRVMNIIERIKNEVSNASKCYIYGAGRWGKICLKLLKLKGVKTEGFVVTRKNEESIMEDIPLYEIGELNEIRDNLLFIVAVSDNSSKKEIIRLLDDKKYKYLCVLE